MCAHLCSYILFCNNIYFMLTGAMKDVRSRELLMQGFLVLLPVFDEAGRALIYINTSKYIKLGPNTEEVSFIVYLVYSEQLKTELYSNLLTSAPFQNQLLLNIKENTSLVVSDTCSNGESKLSKGCDLSF